MKKINNYLILLSSVAVMILLFSFSVSATESNTQSTAEVLQLYKTSEIQFNPVYVDDGYYDEYGDYIDDGYCEEYTFNYWYVFIPTKTSYYEFYVDFREDVYCTIAGKPYDDVDGNIFELSAGQRCYVYLSGYVEDYPIECQVYVSEHTHYYDEFDTYQLKATEKKDGYIDKTCFYCGYHYHISFSRVKTISISDSEYTFSNKTITPVITVKDSKGKTLVLNKDYSISGSTSAKNVGTYYITVKLKGNYSGSKKLKYKIKPVAPSFSVSAIGNGFAAKIKSQPKETTGYQIQYSKKSDFSSAKTITDKKYSILSQKVTGLTADSVYYVRARSFKTISDTNYYSLWTNPIKVRTLYAALIKLNSSSLKLATTQTATLKTTVVPSSSKITWRSSDKSIASVNSKGNVTAKKPGTATITASIKYNGKTYSAKCKTTVKSPAIKLSKESLSVHRDSSYTLKFSTFPSKQSVKWTTSNSSIATVSAGKIKAKRIGKCTITAYFTFSGKTYKALCKVTVKDPTYLKHQIGEYTVGVQKYQVRKSSGNYYLIVNYYFKNNSDENAEFGWSIIDTAFQNKVELDRGYIIFSGYNSQLQWKKVQPGGHLTVQVQYKLKNKTSPVTLELYNWDDEGYSVKLYL